MNPETTSTTPIVVADPLPAATLTKVRHRAAAAKDDACRCLHRYANGRRCALPGPKAGFCFRHFQNNLAAGLPLLPAPSDFEDLSADLLQPSEADAALSINQFLSRLLVLVTKGRVTPRRAAVLAYITNQILHSHRATSANSKSKTNSFFLRPDRSRPCRGVVHPTPAEVYDPGHN